jgi:hypothetical protein
MRKRCGYCLHFLASDNELVRNRGYDGVCSKLMYTKMRVSAGCDLYAEGDSEPNFPPEDSTEGAVEPPKSRMWLH